MISVNEAKNIIVEHVSKSNFIEIDLHQTSGYALCENIFSPIDYPPFHQSAMDGYAFRFDEWKLKNELKINSEIKAGDSESEIQLTRNVAVRIFTGAKIPTGFDTVVVQEKVIVEQDILIIQDENLRHGANIKLQGTHTKANDLILEKGSSINAATVSLLASVGIDKIKVFRKPKITIINTGNELIKIGNELAQGKIFESNSVALQIALQQMHIEVQHIHSVADNLEALKEALINASIMADMVIITGGVSVGDYDFVHQALTDMQANILFHKVKQKPGKPILFAKQNDKIFFGLPGNPASVLMCFYQYVLPALRQMMGFENPELLQLYLPIENEINKKAGFTHFLQAKITERGVQLLEHQVSHKMNSFALANAIIEIESDTEKIERGTLVKVYLL